MASGAGRSPTGQPLGAMREEPATPPARRPEAPTLGTSPGSKRPAKREVAASPSDIPEMTHMQLVAEVHKIYLQAQLDATFFDNTYDQIGNHAERIDGARTATKDNRNIISQLTADVKKLTDEAVSNDANIKNTISDNDEAMHGHIFRV